MLPDKCATFAKASLVPSDMGRAMGRCFQRAVYLSGVSSKEIAGEMGRDPAQISRWMAGTERLQIDAIFSVTSLRQPFVQALAEFAGAAVNTEIRFGRTA